MSKDNQVKSWTCASCGVDLTHLTASVVQRGGTFWLCPGCLKHWRRIKRSEALMDEAVEAMSARKKEGTEDETKT